MISVFIMQAVIILRPGITFIMAVWMHGVKPPQQVMPGYRLIHKYVFSRQNYVNGNYLINLCHQACQSGGLDGSLIII